MLCGVTLLSSLAASVKCTLVYMLISQHTHIILCEIYVSQDIAYVCHFLLFITKHVSITFRLFVPLHISAQIDCSIPPCAHSTAAPSGQLQISNMAYIDMSQLMKLKTSNTVMRRITTFRSTTDRIYDGGHIILYYNTYHCVKIVYSIQYSNMLYR